MIVGPPDDSSTEIIRKSVPGDPLNRPFATPNRWPIPDGDEDVLVGNLDVLNAEIDRPREAGGPVS